MKRFYLALDLKDDPKLIEEYERYHLRVWPEVLASIRQAGIRSMKIFRVENRLFMIMETDDLFSFDKKSDLDQSNPKAMEWEKLMWNYQQALPGSKPGEKWRLMNKIFDLNEPV
ncbi:MAG: L-rhamnose mutarotase [Bacteroidetes bacterium]|nr:L-rhamnose mutarotase [Bacteroidota bacterium]MBS1541970.1 L-rhamnose mutarotase [Bacteroidota bacterium]